MKRLNTTKRIHEGSILRIYKKGFGYTRLRVLENSDHFITVESDREFMEEVSDGDEIQCYLWVEDVASYEFTLKVIGRVSVGEPILLLDHTEEIIRSEQRKCLTAKVNLPIKFFIFDTEQEKKFHSEEVVFYDGTMVELSDRDTVIRSAEEIPENTFIKGHVFIDDRDVEIVGKIDNEADKTNRTYNINFLGMIENDRAMLLDYVFRVYRE